METESYLTKTVRDVDVVTIEDYDSMTTVDVDTFESYETISEYFVEECVATVEEYDSFIQRQFIADVCREREELISYEEEESYE